MSDLAAAGQNTVSGLSTLFVAAVGAGAGILSQRAVDTRSEVVAHLVVPDVESILVAEEPPIPTSSSRSWDFDWEQLAEGAVGGGATVGLAGYGKRNISRLMGARSRDRDEVRGRDDMASPDTVEGVQQHKLPETARGLRRPISVRLVDPNTGRRRVRGGL